MNRRSFLAALFAAPFARFFPRPSLNGLKPLIVSGTYGAISRENYPGRLSAPNLRISPDYASRLDELQLKAWGRSYAEFNE